MSQGSWLTNRATWERWSDGYQAKHGHLLAGPHAAAWGLWRLPEDRAHVLGDVQGKRVLELGCGAAHWSAELARRGASVVALDAAANQLRHARDAVAGLDVHLVQAYAEFPPFRPASFDIVLSDYGAMSWCDPALTVPAVARLLRPGGVLAFCTASPFFYLFLDDNGHPAPTVQRDYFSMRTRRVGDSGIDFHISFGEWLRLLRGHDLHIEDLIEVQPPQGAVTTFRDRPLGWARRCPVENIWRVRRG